MENLLIYKTSMKKGKAKGKSGMKMMMVMPKAHATEMKGMMEGMGKHK